MPISYSKFITRFVGGINFLLLLNFLILMPECPKLIVIISYFYISYHKFVVPIPRIMVLTYFLVKNYTKNTYNCC